MSNRVPKPSLHRASGQAVVRLNGRDFYLGKFGSPGADAAYNRLIATWLANGRTLIGNQSDLTVNELLLAYWRHCETYYRFPDGRATSEIEVIKLAMRPLKALYGTTPAKAFGPAALKTVRQSMVDAGICRTSLNKHVGRIRQMFRWGVEHELVPPSLYHGLQAVRGLKQGRSDAKESAPVRPVPEGWVELVRPFVASPVRAMIDVQLLSGARPGEVCALRGCDLDMSGPIWIYRPKHHKTLHHGKLREIYLGPRAQAIVRHFLKTDLQAALFSPSDARQEQYEKLRRARNTRVQPSQLSRRKKCPKKSPGNQYTVASYRRAIKYACEKAFPLPEHLAPRPRETKIEWRGRLTAEELATIKQWRKEHAWHPHRLRHNAGTSLRKEFGVEVARIILGHSHLRTTEIYAEADRDEAMDVVGKVG
jgi:integrase